MDYKKEFSLAVDLFKHLNNYSYEPVFLCLGTSKLTLDSLGPLVGSALKNNFNIPCFVYGTVENSVTANNLESYVTFIKSKHAKNPVIVIDSALSAEENIGIIKTYNCGTVPRGALENRFNQVGDISIMGFVENRRTFITKSFLLTEKKFVSEMASVIAKAVSQALKLFYITKETNIIAIK